MLRTTHHQHDNAIDAKVEPLSHPNKLMIYPVNRSICGNYRSFQSHRTLRWHDRRMFLIINQFLDSTIWFSYLIPMLLHTNHRLERTKTNGLSWIMNIFSINKCSPLYLTARTEPCLQSTAFFNSKLDIIHLFICLFSQKVSLHRQN